MKKTKWVKSHWSQRKISVADCQTTGWARRDDQNELFHIFKVWVVPALLTEVTTLGCESGRCLAVSRKEKRKKSLSQFMCGMEKEKMFL